MKTFKISMLAILAITLVSFFTIACGSSESTDTNVAPKSLGALPSKYKYDDDPEVRCLQDCYKQNNLDCNTKCSVEQRKINCC